MTPFATQIESTHRTAFHLEQRDAYALGEQDGASFDAFMGGGEPDADPEGAYWGGWTRRIREARGRGVEFRRLRIVSEPLTDYLRWEHAITGANLAAGEQVRWLPRSACLDLPVIPVDHWVFDSARVLFGHFDGNGISQRHELRDDPEIAKLAAETFEAAWSRAIPHTEYNPSRG